MNNSCKKVILVEDNPAEAMLTRLAYQSKFPVSELIHCANGEEFLDLLAQTRLEDICYILLDLNMPRLNGIEVLKIVEKNEKWRLLPIIVFTSSSHEQDIRTCYDHGANAFVTKPLHLDSFDETLAAIHRFWGEINLRPTHF